MTERERFVAWRTPRDRFRIYWDKCIERGAVWAGAENGFAIEMAVEQAVASGALKISAAQERKLINYLRGALVYAAKHPGKQA